LRQAIATIQAVLKILEPNATLRPILLNNLGCCLDDLAKHGKAAKRINAAIDAFREALSLTRADSPDWIVRSLNLAVSLNSLYRLTGDSIPLRESIAIGRALRAETSPATRQGVMVRGNLGSQLAEYANYMQEVSLIEEARAVTYEAIKAIDPDDSSYSVVTGTWGRILHVHSTLADHPSLVAEATAAYRQACQSGIDIAPEHVIRKGNSWGELAMEHGNWPEAAEAYGLAAKAQGLLYTTQLLPEDRYHWLGLAPKLHTNLAYAHARLGDFKQAVSAVESGHAREFGLAMERDRADLTTLESTRPELVARFESCRGALRAWQLSLEHPDMRAGGLDRSDGIHAIMAELRAITADIRAVPGYRRFLEWSDWDDVEAAVTPGSSLVYVLDTARGGLALVVSRQSAQSELSIAPHWLEKLTSAWLEGLLAGVPKRDGGESGQAYWTTVLERFGAALWDVGLGPLLATLASAQAEPLAVVPLGSLLALPLHLAWTELDDRRRYLLDTACLRIVPSARILHLTRAIAQSTDTRRLLVVQDPQPTTQKPLQSARAEAQSISVWYPQVTLLANAEATHAAVMTALAHADIAHFSCHGLADWDDTEKVGLVLAHDTFFYMHDLYSLRLQGARLAVLSACETGIVHPDLPNEVVMFALSFIYAGFAGAVASLWTVPGLSTAMLMERFYRFWHEDHLTPAEALRQAQLWMRDTAWTEKQTYYAGQIGRLEAEGDRYQAAIQALRSFSNALSLRRNELASESPYFWGGFQLIGV
ncbi:MAG TPA: CHAT domain-containing protein, partial [Herpetosiphonaceae bacterium]|nr:CHAT domain-containing protein [Herpetosiphonaceae bacterium]